MQESSFLFQLLINVFQFNLSEEGRRRNMRVPSAREDMVSFNDIQELQPTPLKEALWVSEQIQTTKIRPPCLLLRVHQNLGQLQMAISQNKKCYRVPQKKPSLSEISCGKYYSGWREIHLKYSWHIQMRCQVQSYIRDPDCNNKTSQELLMLSSVTINCQVTKTVMNSGSQLSEL